MAISVERIVRYPIKGLCGESLESADLRPDRGIAHDRRFGLARGDSKMRLEQPRWQPKQRFIALIKDTELVGVRCRLDAEKNEVEVCAPGRESLAASFVTEEGRGLLSAYLNEVLGERREGPAFWMESGEVSFSDVPQDCLSIANLASIRDLEQKSGREIDPARFRANLYIDGAPAWSEFDWIGQSFAVGDVRIRAPARIPRCNATTVNPSTGERDVNVMKGITPRLRPH